MNHRNTLGRRRLSLLGTGALACLLHTAPLQAQLQFLGVASGDASSNEAIIWTRAVDPAVVPNQQAVVTAQVSTDAGFGSPAVIGSATPVASTDYTVKFYVTGLTPGTRYYYRFIGPASEVSIVGTFKTAPDATASYPLRFAFSGDCDGLIRPYALASQVPAKNLDFFMFDGDTEYETSASIGSPAVTSTGNIPDPTVTTPTATAAQLFTDFSRKYRQQFLPVNPSGQNGLQTFFAGQGNYTSYDNHELGNKQYINGGAPAGGPVGSTTGSAPFDFPSGAGVDARVSANDVNTSGTFLNKSGGFLVMQQVFLNYQPVKDRGTFTASTAIPTDANTIGTRQLYFAQQWGRRAIFINTDCRSYRDIRMKTAGNADETGSRADNPSRTYLGLTQLAWLEQTLLAAQQAETTWKFINISDPIDQLGPIDGALDLVNAPTIADYGTLGDITSITTTSPSSGKTITVASTVGLVVGQPVIGANIAANSTIASISTSGTTFALNNTPTATVTTGTTLTLQPAPSTYAPVSSDGGKSWIGGYRSERNALLKFIADNQILNVVFLATDDHQNRVNELTYSTTGNIADQSSYTKVPYCFSVVCGPLGATGPDLISNHTFALAKKLADSIANAQASANLEPIGLGGYPGLHKVTRDGDPQADTLRQPVDFYSPDTFNYNVFDLTPDGTTLTVTSYGINSTVQNGFLEYDAINNPEKVLFSFQIEAASAPEFTSCPDELTVVSTDPGQCSALVSFDAGASGFPTPTMTCTLNGTTISSPWVFPKGTNQVTCTASNSLGQATCSFTVTVNDTEAPVIQSVTPSQSVLWPPNHKMVPVTLAVSATDNCGVASSKIVNVTSNEAANSDWQITGDLSLQLRAERSGNGPGRLYTITVKVSDEAGNASYKSTTVTVPH